MRELDPRMHESDEKAWPRSLAYWRKLPADAFEPELQEEISSCVRLLSSTSSDWKAAIAGDAAAAVNIALELKVPNVMTPAVDLTMTLLLNSAFSNARAALVLSKKLQQAPLPAVERARLAASWRLHHVYLACRSRSATASSDPARRRR